MRRVVPSELIRRINIHGRRCDWEELSKAANSKLSGVQKNRSVLNLILVRAPRLLGMSFLPAFLESGTATGLDLRIDVD